MDKLSEIKAREAAATPGPWLPMRGTKANNPTVVKNGQTIGVTSTNENAAFISWSRTDIPWLIAEVEKLRAENERLKKENEKE